MIYKGSRYTNTPTYYPKGTGNKIFSIRERAKFDLSNATYHTWVSSDTLDYLAYTEYGNSALWWAILDANPTYQTELDISVGDLVVIPPYSEVVRAL